MSDFDAPEFDPPESDVAGESGGPDLGAAEAVVDGESWTADDDLGVDAYSPTGTGAPPGGDATGDSCRVDSDAPEVVDGAGISTSDDVIDLEATRDDAPSPSLGDVARQGMSEELDRIEHDQAEQQAQASLIGPDVAAHMQELDRLGQETNVEHAAAEVDAQQSLPAPDPSAEALESDPELPPGSDGDDLGPLIMMEAEPDLLGAELDDAAGGQADPSSKGPLGFDFEQDSNELDIEQDTKTEAPYAPIEDRELAAHADEIEALHGFDFTHAEIEHDAQQSFDASVSSPVWMSRDEVANSECEPRQDVALDPDATRNDAPPRSLGDVLQGVGEQVARITPDVAAHMQELDRLGQETDVDHAVAEVDAQQSLPPPDPPAQTIDDPGDLETGHDWGIRIGGAASVPGGEMVASTKGRGVGLSGEVIKLEIKNLTTGEVGVFGGIGIGAGVSTPSIDLGASSEWIVFRTADNQELEDFAGRASLSNIAVPFKTFLATIRFEDPDSWVPWVGDIDVEHDSILDSIVLGDSVDIAQATHHLGAGISAGVVVLNLEATRYEAPHPSRGYVVPQGMREELDRIEHDHAEQQAQADLIGSDAGAHMQELDWLGQETDVEHAAAEVDAQQSLPAPDPSAEPLDRAGISADEIDRIFEKLEATRLANVIRADEREDGSLPRLRDIELAFEREYGIPAPSAEAISRAWEREYGAIASLGDIVREATDRTVEQIETDEAEQQAQASLIEPEIAVHMQELDRLHQETNVEHAAAEVNARQSLHAPDPSADAEEIDRIVEQLEHEQAEQQAQASLIGPDVAAHMHELDRLHQDTSVEHAAAEVNAQQSLPAPDPSAEALESEPDLPPGFDGDDLGSLIMMEAEPDLLGPEVEDAAGGQADPSNKGPLGFDFEQDSNEFDIEHDSKNEAPYAPIEDRELAAHADEIEALHGFDGAHAEAEHQAQMSFEPVDDDLGVDAFSPIDSGGHDGRR